MDPKNLTLQRIYLPEYGGVYSSLSLDEILERTAHRSWPRVVTPEYASELVDEVFAKFCTGSYWFFGGLLTLLEQVSRGEPVRLDDKNYLQLLAVLATLADETSNPVVLYPAGLLV